MTNTANRRDPSMLQSSISAGTVIAASTGAGAFQQILLDGRHMLHADEPVAAGGGDTGPGPYELLLMALGSCTSSRRRCFFVSASVMAIGKRSIAHSGSISVAGQ